MAKIVNRQEIGEIMDVSQQTISDWLAKGMPVLDRGAAFSDGAYDTGAVIRWRVEQELARASLEKARDRLDRATAELREMDLAKRRGELVEVDAMIKVWTSIVVAARLRVLALATAPDVPESFRATLADRVRDALRELSEHDPRTVVESE